MVSCDSAECKVTDVTQPLTYNLPEDVRHPREGVGGNRSASSEPLYDAEFMTLFVSIMDG